MDINDQGQIVGFYADANGTYHGYVGDNGRFTGIDPPCAADVPNFDTTVPFGINKPWPVVGPYVGAAGVLHGRTITYGSQGAASKRSIPRRSPASTTTSRERAP